MFGVMVSAGVSSSGLEFLKGMSLSELYRSSISGKSEPSQQKSTDVSYIPNDEFVELISEKMVFLILWVLMMMFEDERGLGFDDVLEDDVDGGSDLP
ncbi:hypothetical protein HanXRQr2_Chr11g0513391 [Helianthus annuus]|uniref:Uncharacterized protein n=1 Tax=Helianthus annuus TaxID=4232 RepID=A0A251TE41_HELAN|nr:hypothetical protein HanXRQr2_Chr11g0513391 [Helianthus annuus]KAJ0511402.1 hypothetical protein HanIR_Chr11g0551771 [Helianthus annuus]